MWSFSLPSPHFQKKSSIMKKSHLALSLFFVVFLLGNTFVVAVPQSTGPAIYNGTFMTPALGCGAPCDPWGPCGSGMHSFIPSMCVQPVGAFGWQPNVAYWYIAKVHAVIEGTDVYTPSEYTDSFAYLNHHAPSMPNIKIWQYNMLGYGYDASFYSYSFYHRGVSGSSTIRFDVVSRDTGQICHSHVATTGDNEWVNYSGEFHRPNINGNGYELSFTTISANGASLLTLVKVNMIDPPPTNCPDLTGNQIIDSVDLAIVLGAWNSSGGEFGADINQDGIVDAMDLGMLLGAWGACYQ